MQPKGGGAKRHKRVGGDVDSVGGDEARRLPKGWGNNVAEGRGWR